MTPKDLDANPMCHVPIYLFFVLQEEAQKKILKYQVYTTYLPFACHIRRSLRKISY